MAATAIGLAIRVDAKSDYDDTSRGCSGTLCPTSDIVDHGNAARDRMLGGSILAGVGVAAMASAGVWWLLSARASDQPSDVHALSVRVQATADGCAVRLYGAF